MKQKTDGSGNQGDKDGSHQDGGQQTPDDNTGGDGSEGDNGGEGTPPESTGEQEGEKDGKLDISKLDPQTQKYIKSLRGECAKFRTKANAAEERYSALDGRLKKIVGGEDDDDLTPEERAEAFEMQAGGLTLENSFLKLAIDNGVSSEGLDYFNFLMNQAVHQLEEDEELDEDSIEEIVNKVKKVSGGGNTVATSVTKGSSGNGTPSPDKTPGITIDEFCAMNIFKKTELYNKQPDVYQKLFNEAKNKGLI